MRRLDSIHVTADRAHILIERREITSWIENQVEKFVEELEQKYAGFFAQNVPKQITITFKS